jgi:hypothetical protein
LAATVLPAGPLNSNTTDAIVPSGEARNGRKSDVIIRVTLSGCGKVGGNTERHTPTWSANTTVLE